MLLSALPKGLRAPFLAAQFGRLPAGAFGLLLVLLVQERTGSFAAGGAVAAAGATGFAVVAPLLGRLVDRHGQGFVLVSAASVAALGLAAVALLPAGTPLALVMLAAFVAGSGHPPLSPAMRAIWTGRLRDRRDLHAAYALDSVVGEVLYILGPLVFVAAIGAWSFQAAMLVAAAVTLLGTALYVGTAAARSWRPAPRGDGPRDLLGAMRSPGVRVLCGSMVVFAIGVAAMEIAVAAFAEAHGAPRMTGVVLAVWGAGSLVGGIWAARRGPGDSPAREIAGFYALIALATVPLALASDVLVLAILITGAGFFIAPALTVAFRAAADAAPRGSVTEANTWMGTGMGTGIALGGALSGQIVEAFSPAVGFLTAAAFFLAAGALVHLGRATLTGLTPSHTEEHPAPVPVPA